MILPLVGGPFHGSAHDAPACGAPLQFTQEDGYRASYRIGRSPDGPALIFDPLSAPAWATRENPVIVDVDGSSYRLWPSSPHVGDSRWCIAGDNGTDILVMDEVDVDMDVERLELMILRWLVAPPFRCRPPCDQSE